MYKLKDGIERKLIKGDKITLGFMNDWGVQVTVRGVYDSVEVEEYAQYEETLVITMRPYRKQYNYIFRICPREHLSIWEGWHDFEGLNEKVEVIGDGILRSAKYGLCDIGFFEELHKKVEPIVSYFSKKDWEKFYKR